MKKINNYQWLSNCGKFGIQKVCINDAETKFNYNVCDVYECGYGFGLQFEPFETCAFNEPSPTHTIKEPSQPVFVHELYLYIRYIY